jgi:hypothetical protein
MGTLKKAVRIWPKDRNIEILVDQALSYLNFVKQKIGEEGILQ